MKHLADPPQVLHAQRLLDLLDISMSQPKSKCFHLPTIRWDGDTPKLSCIRCGIGMGRHEEGINAAFNFTTSVIFNTPSSSYSTSPP